MSITAGLDDRDERLAALIADGRSVADTASALAVSCATVYRRMRRPAVRAAIADLRAASWNPIALELRAGVLVAVQQLRHLAESAQSEGVRATAATRLVELALKLEDLTDTKLRLAALEAHLDATEEAEPSNES